MDEDFVTGQIDALCVAVRALIGSLSAGDTAAFRSRFESDLQELRDRMIATRAQETYFQALDHHAAYIGNAMQRTAPSSGSAST